jgi:hypothetical protein
MIILVKNRNNKRLAVKSLSALSLFLMFFLYYNHMSTKLQEENFHLSAQLEHKEKVAQKLTAKSIQFENLIFEEAKMIVELLDQKHIQSIQIVGKRLLLICDYSTQIEPLLIRYGANALIKNSDRDIKIAIDLAVIVENKYEA